MSFEVKYDRDGMPLKKKDESMPEVEAPQFVQESQESPQELPEPEVDTQEVPDVSNQREIEIAASQENTSNIRALREKAERAERAERERDEALRILREIEARKQQDLPEDLELNLKPDDLAEGKHLSKVDKKIRNLEAELARYKQQSSQVTAEARLRSQYNDFDKVVSKENIDAFRMAYPEIASTINPSADLYSAGVAVYSMIKKFGIYREPNYNEEKAIAQKNFNKPRPVSSIAAQSGDSPLSRANAFASGLTEDLKAQLRREMEEARRSM